MVAFDAGVIEASLVIQRDQAQRELDAMLAQYEALKAKLGQGIDVPVRANLDDASLAKLGATRAATDVTSGTGVGLLGTDPALLKKLEQEAANPGGIGLIGTGTDTTLTRLLRQQLEKQAQSGGLIPSVGAGQSGSDVQRAVQEVTQQVVNQAAAPAPVTQLVHEQLVGAQAGALPSEVTETVNLDYGPAIAEAAVAGQEAGTAFDAGLDRSPLMGVTGVLGGLFDSVSGAPAADAGQRAGTSFSDGLAAALTQGGAAEPLNAAFTGAGAGALDTTAAGAGQRAGTSFSGGLARALTATAGTAAAPLNTAFSGADAAGLDAAAGVAGERAATSFSDGLADALAGAPAVAALNKAFTGADAAALDEAAATAGDRAATSFTGGLAGALSGDAASQAASSAFTGPSAASVDSAANSAGQEAGGNYVKGVLNGLEGSNEGGVTGFGAVFSFLHKEFALFGGALGDIPGLGNVKILSAVTGLHILLDSLLEVSAVLIPATIAFVAFGVAAAPAVKAIVEQMINLNTAEAATGQMTAPLAGHFQTLANSVKPEVYELFGEALLIGTKNGNSFAIMATGVGQVLDQLGARFDAALLSKGVSDFAETAVDDFKELGQVVGNLGGVFGNLMKVMPGYAELLLKLADAGTGVLEWATRVGEPIIGVGLAMHGALVWGGLFATALIKVASGALGLAAGGLAKAAGTVGELGSVGAKAGSALAGFSVMADRAAALPWGWIAIAVAGLAALAYWSSTLKDKTEEWVDSLESAIAASNAVQGAGALLNSYVDVTNRLGTAQNQLADSTAKSDNASRNLATRNSQANATYNAQWTSVQELSAAQQQLADQTDLYTYRVGVLATMFGGLTQAQGLLNVAGITTNQILNGGRTQLLQLEDQLKAVTLGYGAMGIAGGRLGAVENALNFTQAEQFTAVQKANQAADTYISTIVGGESAFIAFQQGLAQTATDAKASGASIGGLNAKSLTLANDFYTTLVPAAQKVVDSLNLQDVSTKNLTTVVATQSKELLTYAGNNKAARAAIVDLINNALGPGTVSLKTLNTWVHTNAGTLAQYKQIVDKAEESTSNLAKAINAQLTTSFANDVVQASGASKQLRTYTQDILNNQQTTSKGEGDRAQLIADLRKAGLSAQQANTYVDGLTKSLGKVPAAVHTEVVFGGAGTVSVTAAEKDVVAHIEGGMASGGRINAGTGPTADDVLIRASRGETVLSAAHSQFLAPLLAAMGVRGYANGGVIPGQIQALDSNVQNTAAAGMDQLVKQQVLGALQQLVPPSGVSSATFDQIENWWTGAGGPGGVARIAAAITGAESGFNVKAVQQGQPYATTGWGLWQITPGDSEPQFGINDQLLNGPANAGAAVAKYRGAGGFSPWTTYEDGAYTKFLDQGGWLMPGATLAVNHTGRPEAVTPAATFDQLGGKLDKIAALLGALGDTARRAPGRTADGVSQALGGVARGATYRAMYSTR